jgi:hypothetical protein
MPANSESSSSIFCAPAAASFRRRSVGEQLQTIETGSIVRRRFCPLLLRRPTATATATAHCNDGGGDDDDAFQSSSSWQMTAADNAAYFSTVVSLVRALRRQLQRLVAIDCSAGRAPDRSRLHARAQAPYERVCGLSGLPDVRTTARSSVRRFSNSFACISARCASRPPIRLLQSPLVHAPIRSGGFSLRLGSMCNVKENVSKSCGRTTMRVLEGAAAAEQRVSLGARKERSRRTVVDF